MQAIDIGAKRTGRYRPTCRHLHPSDLSWSEGDRQMLSVLLLGLITVMRLWPSVPFVRALHKMLVEIPIMWIARAERSHTIVILVVAAMLIAGGEMLAIFGSLDALFFFLIDLSMYLDAVSAVLAVAAASRVKTTYQLFRASFVSAHRLPIPGSMRRSSREVRPRRIRRVANDDNEGRTDLQAASNR